MSEKRAKKAPIEVPVGELLTPEQPAPKSCSGCAEKDAKIAELETALRVLSR